jgi:hypothetical protein
MAPIETAARRLDASIAACAALRHSLDFKIVPSRPASQSEPERRADRPAEALVAIARRKGLESAAQAYDAGLTTPALATHPEDLT